jgi:phage-related protein
MAAFWTNTLYPALQTVGNWMQTYLVPVLEKIWNWLGVALPPVIQAMATLWTNVLLPSMRAVWKLLSDYVFPVLKALADLVGAVLNVAFQVLGEIFTKIIAPVFERVAGILTERLSPAFETGASIVGAFRSALEGLGGIIDGIVSALERLADKIRNLPKLNLPSLPGFAMGTNYAPGGMSWVGERGPELVNLPKGSQVYTAQESQRMTRGGGNWTVNVNVSGGGDAQAIGRAVERGVLQAARAMGAA